ncbi:MAG: alpha/beta hydrolase [Alphaproteobacteria bacterium]
MTDTAQILAREGGASIAYRHTSGRAPGVVFLGGFMSDMTGTKAVALEAWARSRGQAFLRFDYQGHGQSSGRFADGTIGIWTEDALAALDQLTDGPQILVGSSMGGWIMLKLALARPARIAALVGIAAAPDFVVRMWDDFSDEVRREIERDGRHHAPSQYGAEPYTITRALIEDGRRQLVMDRRIEFSGPVRLLHGMADPDVPWRVALDLAQALASTDVAVTLVKDGDHRLSRPEDVARLRATLDDLCGPVR